MKIRWFAVRVFMCAVAALILPLSASAQMTVTPSTITLQAVAGASVPSQTVTVRNTSGQRLRWSVLAPTATWLRVSRTKGTNSGTITVSFVSPPTTAGTHSASFRVQSETVSVTVTANLTIVAAPTPPPPPSLTGLSVTGPTSLGTGQTAQYTARASYSDGSSTSLTSGPAWSTSNGLAAITQGGLLTALAAGTLAVQASYGGQSAQLPGITVAPPQIAALTVSCPANMSVVSTNGSAVAVTYSASTLGGVAPVTVSGSPASGSAFPVGTTSVAVTARSSDGQTASCGFSVTATYTAPPPPPPAPSASAVGPQSTITCPSGAVDVWPGMSIQSTINVYPSTTTFCIRAGVHSLNSSITPRSGSVFVGEYGAILDGTGWATADDTQAAFRAHNQDIDYVTIRNLVIRNMPQRGIHAFHYMSNNWTVEYNEIGPNRNVGIVFGGAFTIKNNYIHHNAYSGYMGPYAHNSTLENNEIAYNGWQQKVMESANVTFRNNFVHHNVGAGIWFDSDNTGTLIEGNRVEDNGHVGIWYEISGAAIIRNNTLRRNVDAGVFISTSKNAEIYNNTFEGNFRGITYFVNCPSVGGGILGFDLANNSAHDNRITVGTQPWALASVFSYGSCTTTQAAPYVNGSKNLTFSRNTYRVPSPTSVQYWHWNGFQYWDAWQLLPQDAGSTVSQ